VRPNASHYKGNASTLARRKEYRYDGGMKEASVEDHLKAVVGLARGRCIKMHPLGAVGIPDRLVLLPGFIGLVELKRPKGGVLSTKQKLWRTWLVERDIPYALLWTKEAVDGYMRAYHNRMGS